VLPPFLYFDRENDMGEIAIYCDWMGFTWTWDFVEEQWRIDLEKSGGPPSPNEPMPLQPPCVVV
jgi:hypothetical protein